MPEIDHKDRWYAVYTKPRQEQVALWHLENQGFVCFLPLALNPYQRSRKKPGTEREPLFPRYLFLRANPQTQNLATVRSTRGAVTLVRQGGHPVEVAGWVIDALKARREEDTGLIRLDPVNFKAGDKVRVFDGPLVGAEGILQQRCGEKRSLLLMNILGRESLLEVDSLLLQRAG